MGDKGYFSAKSALEALFPLTGAGQEELEAALATYDQVGRDLESWPDASPFLAALGNALQYRSPYETMDERWQTGRARQVALSSTYSGKLHKVTGVFRTSPPSPEERDAFRGSGDAFLLACDALMDDPYRRATA